MNKKTSLILDDDLWFCVKKYCLDKKISITDYLNELLRSDVKIMVYMETKK